MQAISYYLALPFLYLISLLPFGLLYALSDFIFLVLYYIVGYRKKIVMENLRNSFPEKNEEDLKIICRKFYSYLCNLTLETLKGLTANGKTLMKRCTFDESAQALFDDYAQRKQSIIIVMGHFGNWEWAGHSFTLHCTQQLYVIYHPLANPYFNKFIVKLRTRLGTKLIKMDETFREMIRNRREVSSTAFIADQTPSPENAYWTTFLQQDTPIFRGTEIIARKLNYPVVYASVKRIRRGYYKIFAETLFEEPAETIDGEISEAHSRKLEREIMEQPEIWLWSHRRWKHQRV